MSTPFYNLFQNFVISVLTRNYIFILKRLSTNIDFIQCLLTNKQSLRTTVQLLQYKDLRYATPNFKILQTFFYLSLYGRFLYLPYYIQYLLIISIMNLNCLTIYAILALSIPLFLQVVIRIQTLLLITSYATCIISIILSLYSIYILYKSISSLCLPTSRFIGFILYRFYLIWPLFYISFTSFI